MKLNWHLFFAAAIIIVQENLCVPAIRPLSNQRRIIFPEDNWDDCFLDKESTQPGMCKSLEQCPEILKKWDNENVYPKTCYFIKKEQFVCCPIATAKEVSSTTKTPFSIFHDVFNTDPGLVTKKPKVETTTVRRPSNIFLDNLTTKPTPKRPSNIFLDKVTAADKTTTKTPSIVLPDIFNTEKPINNKRRNEIECDLQNSDINGESAQFSEFPFMAALGFKSNGDNKIWYPCNGVLVSSRYILTAAHCAEIGGEKPSFVQLGLPNLKETEEGSIKIKQINKHQSYEDSKAIYNDIALVELDQEVNNRPVCLWSLTDIPITKLTSLGYGHSRLDGLGPNELVRSPLTTIENAECQEYYNLDDKFENMYIGDDHVCAGEKKQLHESCQSETGGSLIMELDKVFYVVGISSYGLGCADLPPSIYTRVSSFIDWIEQIVWPEIDVRFDRK
ncbi:Serine protease snake [Lucilia cuprina]|uniref:Serine protease snake n=1 Tax=Lucilia cuprina TaxID=7375 RepID=A0A0L0BZ20_LUCCU|nr:Serine protease snake [Lucilia cuprina]KNC24484.1 Serine protease snake [Lucilia cuprina]